MADRGNPEARKLCDPNIAGALVEIKVFIEDECETYEYVGHVSHIIKLSSGDWAVVMKDCKLKLSGKSLPANQEFEFDTIEKVTILESGKEKLETQPAALTGRRMDATVPFRSDNKHLKKLHPIQMNELLEQKQFYEQKPLEQSDTHVGSPYLLPPVTRSLNHMEGDIHSQRRLIETETIRKFVWKDIDTWPQLTCVPMRWYLIADFDKDGEALQMALDEIKVEQVIGVSLQAKLMSRFGELSCISITTPDSIFTFDIVQLGYQEALLKIFDAGLRQVLESDKIIKVFHNCRLPSDLLWHKFSVKLNNVYDTQAAHSVFSTWAMNEGHLPKYTVSVSNLAKAYLGIDAKFLFFPHYRLDHLKEDMSIWMHRPLTPEVSFGIISDARFLLELRKMTMKAMMSPHEKVVEVLLTDVRDKVTGEFSIGSAGDESRFLLPERAVLALPSWSPNETNVSRIGLVEGRQVHQVVGQAEGLVIFSRDCMHQNKRL